MEKKYTTIIVILLIVIVGLSGFIVYDKFSDNDIEDSSNNEVAEEDDSSSEVHALSGRFAFKDNNVIYSADYSDFLENGVKEVIADDVDRLANMVMFNYNIYYIDNTGKLVVYNPYKKSSIEYTFEGVKIHANTVILPGKDYTIISDCSNFIRIDMKEKNYKKLDITSRNYKMKYDDDSKLLYYISGQEVVAYDVVNEKSAKVIANNMGPEFIVDDELYLFNFQNNVLLGVYNKTTGEINNLDFNSYGVQVFTPTIVGKINGNLYFLSGEHTLFKYSNNSISSILNSGFLRTIVVGANIFIEDSEVVCSDVCWAGNNEKYYVYNTLEEKLSDVNYAYISSLFEFKNVFYY